MSIGKVGVTNASAAVVSCVFGALWISAGHTAGSQAPWGETSRCALVLKRTAAEAGTVAPRKKMDLLEDPQEPANRQ